MVVNQRPRRYTSLTWKAENAMERLNIIQTVVEMTRAKTYLEIGVASGAIFFRVKARHKIAVDPRFEFSTMKRLRYLIKNPWNIANKYYEMTSDEFFQNEGANVEQSGIDVAFVDGLHTFEQSLTDVSNCLRYLNKGGVIILILRLKLPPFLRHHSTTPGKRTSPGGRVTGAGTCGKPLFT